jgi:glycosyltransferase involved in cell wall biosynthesis
VTARTLPASFYGSITTGGLGRDMRQVENVGGAEGRYLAVADRSAVAPELAEIASAAGLRRVQVIGWRDLDDQEAGGSEVYASTIARLSAEAGIDVTMLTSAVQGDRSQVRRDGYHVIRRFGRFTVFPRMAMSGALGRLGRPDVLVEIWNGMPFFSPLWARCPRVVFLHHVHAEMWDMTLAQPALARLGKFIEFRGAPPLYRASRIVTLSRSSRREIAERLGLPGTNIEVVPPGVDPRFSPGHQKDNHPLVVAVGRPVPVKRFDLLINALVELRQRHPTLRAVIVGEGYERPRLEARIRAADAGDWLSLPGRLSDDELVRLYRRAWVAAATSLREGWGMTLTEAAACGTPAVAIAITGHVDAVVHETTRLLVSQGGNLVRDMVTSLDAVLIDADLRDRLGTGALARVRDLTWEATAKGALLALAAEASRSRRLTRAPAALGPAPTAPTPLVLGFRTTLTTPTAGDPRR